MFAVGALIAIAACGNSGPESPRETSRPTTPTPGLEYDVLVEIERCDPGEAIGTVTNNGDETVNVFIDVTFEDADGVKVGDRIATARAVAPGTTRDWDAPYLGINDYETCHARISSVFSAPD